MKKKFLKSSNDIVIYLNPEKINSYLHSFPLANRLNNLLFRKYTGLFLKINEFIISHQSIFVSDRFFKYQFDLTRDLRYIYLKDLINLNGDYKKSMWYKSLILEYNLKGYASYKYKFFSNLGSIEKFFEDYILKLIESLKVEGYKPELGLGTIVIDDRGKILKSGSGNHRFYICKILGIDKIPLRIDYISKSYYIKNPKINLNELIVQIIDKYS
jgi:GTPase SAR1 family protein